MMFAAKDGIGNFLKWRMMRTKVCRMMIINGVFDINRRKRLIMLSPFHYIYEGVISYYR